MNNRFNYSIKISSLFCLAVLLFALDYDNNFSYGYDGPEIHDYFHFSTKGKMFSDDHIFGTIVHTQINGNSGVIVSGTPNGVTVIRLDVRPYHSCEDIKYAICFESIISDVKNIPFSIGDKVLLKFISPEKQIISIINGDQDTTIYDIDLIKTRIPHLKDISYVQEQLANINKAELFKEKFPIMFDLIKTNSIKELLKNSNLEFSALNDPYSVIDQRNEEWIESEGLTPLMIALNEKETSKLFKKMVSEDIEKNSGIIFREIILTNAYGANVAQSQRTTDYKQWDEEWWMITRQSGAYFTTGFDESVNANTMDMHLRILDDNEEFLGIIKFVMTENFN